MTAYIASQSILSATGAAEIPSAVAWAIGDVSEVKVWAEPDAAFYTLATGRLATWGNTDGGRVALVPDTNTPLWEADSGNGIGGFLFDQARPDSLKTSATIGVTTFCTWIGYKDAAANQTILMEHSANATPNNGHWLYTDSGALRVKRTAGISDKNAAVNWGSTGGFLHVRHEFDGTHAGHVLYKNGASVSLTDGAGTADPGSATVTDTLYVGGRTAGALPLHGPLQFLVFATPIPSAGDRALITADLVARYY